MNMNLNHEWNGVLRLGMKVRKRTMCNVADSDGLSS